MWEREKIGGLLSLECNAPLTKILQNVGNIIRGRGIKFIYRRMKFEYQANFNDYVNTEYYLKFESVNDVWQSASCLRCDVSTRQSCQL